VRPKASGAGLICRTDQYFQRQRLPCTCRIKTVKSVRGPIYKAENCFKDISTPLTPRDTLSVLELHPKY